jgi:hypothetical protein
MNNEIRIFYISYFPVLAGINDICIMDSGSHFHRPFTLQELQQNVNLPPNMDSLFFNCLVFLSESDGSPLLAHILT